MPFKPLHCTTLLILALCSCLSGSTEPSDPGESEDVSHKIAPPVAWSATGRSTNLLSDPGFESSSSNLRVLRKHRKRGSWQKSQSDDVVAGEASLLVSLARSDHRTTWDGRFDPLEKDIQRFELGFAIRSHAQASNIQLCLAAYVDGNPQRDCTTVTADKTVRRIFLPLKIASRGELHRVVFQITNRSNAPTQIILDDAEFHAFVAAECTPSCDDKECGNDGCGGTCGSCSGGATCSDSGLCHAEPPGAPCRTLTDCMGAVNQAPGCLNKSSVVWYEEAQCVYEPWEATCDDFQLCQADPKTHCTRGPPGSTPACNPYGECIYEFPHCGGACAPACDGRECGPDGCGGSCGECDGGASCTSGTCTPERAPPPHPGFDSLPCKQVVAGTCELNVPSSGSLQNPAWSPDGKFILFTNFANGYNMGIPTLKVLDLTTGSVRTIGTGVNLPGNTNTWSDSQHTVFSHEPEGNENKLTDEKGPYVVAGEQAYVQQPSGGALTPITNYPDDAWEPTFSPAGTWTTGNWLAFQDKFDAKIIITQVFDDHKVRRDQVYYDITGPFSIVKQPVWSPSGRHIVYQAREGGVWGLWIVDVPVNPPEIAEDATAFTRPFDLPGTDPSFSPSGDAVVFSGGGTRYDTLFTVIFPQSRGQPMGRPVKVTTRTDVYEGAPGWSRDGSLIAYESSPGAPGDIGHTTLWVAPVP